MKYINRSANLPLVSEDDNKGVFKLYIDYACAVHIDMKRYTGIIMLMGRGLI